MATVTRIRRKATDDVTPKVKLDGIKALAEQTEALQDEIRQLQNQVDANKEQMLQFMERYPVKSIDAEFGTFNYVVPKGRSTTEIRTEELAAMLSEEDFLDCVKPSVTQCRKHLSEKELKSISKTHPGKPGDPKVDYKPKK